MILYSMPRFRFVPTGTDSTEARYTTALPNTREKEGGAWGRAHLDTATVTARAVAPDVRRGSWWPARTKATSSRRWLPTVAVSRCAPWGRGRNCELTAARLV